MAKALQCPDCGERHPLDQIGTTSTFRCQGCRRLLKVPASVVTAKTGTRATNASTGSGSSSPSGSEEGRDQTATLPARDDATEVVPELSTKQEKVPPSQRGDTARIERTRSRSSRAAGRVRSRVPRTLRVLVWIVAMPVGLVPVLLIGRVAGLFTLDTAIDVFVGTGIGRFVPVLLLVPMWAAASASLAHFTIEGLARVWSGSRFRDGNRSPADGGEASDGTGVS